VYEVRTGKLIRKLLGHMGAVNCCVYNAEAEELYSGGCDGQILIWRMPCIEEGEEVVGGAPTHD
jgi:WD40 repeat protein